MKYTCHIRITFMGDDVLCGESEVYLRDAVSDTHVSIEEIKASAWFQKRYEVCHRCREKEHLLILSETDL